MIPLILSLAGKRCVIIGGGSMATRRLLTLLQSDAQITIVSPEITPTIESSLSSSRISWKDQAYEENNLEGAFLVIAATNNTELNHKIVQEAKRRGILCNDVGDAEEGDVIIPGILQKGDLIISVSTQGASPSLSKNILHQIDEKYGEEYIALLEILREVRTEVKRKIPDLEGRKTALNQLVAEDILLEMIREGRVEEARQKAFSCIW